MKKITDELKMKVANRVEKGDYNYQIAKELGISESSIVKIRKELKIYGGHTNNFEYSYR